MPKTDLFYRVNEIAERLDVSTRTVRRWIEMGFLRAHRLGRSVRVSDADLKTFLTKRVR